jgi:hypothetical protein
MTAGGGLLMELAALISKRNLELAWRRIVTGRNLQHKRFFRHLYGGYEIGLKENINLLHDRLSGNWHATPPTRIYIPKSSGLLRPITLLAIEDQIVLQAIANKVALRIRARRRKVELKKVFSNCLERRADSIFFLQDWRKSYQAFQRLVGSRCGFPPCRRPAALLSPLGEPCHDHFFQP